MIGAFTWLGYYSQRFRVDLRLPPTLQARAAHGWLPATGVSELQLIAAQSQVVVAQEMVDISRRQMALGHAPLISLSQRSRSVAEIGIEWTNVGRCPALNFRYWIEDPAHLELKTAAK